jgi:dTDP-4-amino-4,6-dideoxygalactose transaminase
MSKLKKTIAELAYFGGPASFERPLHVAHASVSQKKRFFELLEEVFSTGRFTNDGPMVRELERRIAELLRVKHCIVVCNGTVGLQVAAKSLGMRGEVIVPSFTFIATAHALKWLGIRPVFCDIDPITHTVDPDSVLRAVNRKTKGIIGVHLWGQACNIEALTELARNHGIPLMFDAAHAFGSSYKGTMVGNFGDAEVFSFHATKLFHTFEGGAIVTNNSDIAERASLLRNYGFVDYDKVVMAGINAKMNEICAAMGLASLETLNQTIEGNRKRYACYARNIANIPGVTLRQPSAGESNYQYVVMEIDTKTCILSRNEVMALLWAENVLARRYFYPGCHRMEPYLHDNRTSAQSLIDTEEICERVLVLPTGENVGTRSVEGICRLVEFIMTNAEDIAKHLRKQ